MSSSRGSNLLAWASLDKLTNVTGLAFNLIGLLAALIAANFFFFQPNVQIRSFRQLFIDTEFLQSSYTRSDTEVPAVVLEVADEYNRRNEADLKAESNSTTTELPAVEVCAQQKTVVEQVFGDGTCEQENPVIGRERFYERLLMVWNAGKPRTEMLGPPALRDAVAKLGAAEYTKANVTADNTGNGKAVNVRIQPPEEFYYVSSRAVLSFSLGPNASRSQLFRTDTGLGSDASRDFAIDWDSDQAVLDRPVLFITLGVATLFILGAVGNDMAHGLRSP